MSKWMAYALYKHCGSALGLLADLTACLVVQLVATGHQIFYQALQDCVTLQLMRHQGQWLLVRFTFMMHSMYAQGFGL